jgi:hypothetical protein
VTSLRRRLLAATLRGTAALSCAWVPADGAATPAEQLSGGGTLTASTAQLAGLVYDGLATVSTPAGDLQAIQLTSSSAALTDLQLHVPCTAVPGLGQGIATDVATASGSTAAAPDGLTLYATRISAATSAGPVSWTPAAPPTAQQLGDVTLTDAEIDFLGIAVTELSLPGLTQATRFCTP